MRPHTVLLAMTRSDPMNPTQPETVGVAPHVRFVNGSPCDAMRCDAIRAHRHVACPKRKISLSYLVYLTTRYFVHTSYIRSLLVSGSPLPDRTGQQKVFRHRDQR